MDQLHMHTDAPPGKPLLSEREGIPKGWPTTPKPVKRTVTTYLTNSVVDIALLTLSVSFLVFALAVRHYDQASTAEHPQAKQLLLSLSRLGPTIFPILFAAIIGRTSHAILLWRLEKDESIGILDLLAGSTSLTSTVNSQLQLRIASIFGILLVAIWALSPIGGQASIRQLGFGNGTESQNVTISYLLPTTTNDTYSADSRNSLLHLLALSITKENELHIRSEDIVLLPGLHRGERYIISDI